MALSFPMLDGATVHSDARGAHREVAPVGHGPSDDPRVDAFHAEGYLGPVRLFSRDECARIGAYLGRPDPLTSPDWGKSRAVRERFLFEIATRPGLISLVTAILGEDVVLWGASALLRAPGVSHPWHSDIESCGTDGGFVTAWVGIAHTTRESALELITRSHTLGATVQEVRQQIGLRRELATPEIMLAAARRQDEAAMLVQPDMTEGDALLFDGRLWHGSLNRRKRGKRLALLLQYAAADRAVGVVDIEVSDASGKVIALGRGCYGTQPG